MRATRPGILFFACLLLGACSAESPPGEASTRLRDSTQQEPPRPPFFRIDRADSLCRAELQQARADVQRGQLTYSQRGRFRYAEDLDTLLQAQGIGFAFNPMPCTSEGDCYAYYMDSVITRARGAGFIPGLKQAAYQRFLSQWRTRTYGAAEVEVSPISPVGDVDAYLTAHLLRPQGWDTLPKREPHFHWRERQYLLGSITIDRTGQLTNLEWLGMNLKTSNRRFLPYFRREISRLVFAMEPWQPGRVAGHRVTSAYYLDVTLNPEQ